VGTLYEDQYTFFISRPVLGMTALGKCMSTFSIPLIGSIDNAQHSYPYKTQDRLAFKESQHSALSR